MAETLSYQSIRTANAAREADEQKTEIRKKNLLILVLQYLSEQGYVDSVQSLSKETNIDLNKYEVCDNVDLDTVLMEYESYYYIKFSRYPKITKKLTQSGDEHSRRGTRASKLRRDQGGGSTPSLPRLPASGQQKPPTPPIQATSNRPKSGARRQTSVNSTPTRTYSKQNGGPGATQSGFAQPGGEPLALTGTVVSSNQADTGRKPRGQIIDIRSMINDATRLHTEEGGTGFTNAGADPSEKLLRPLGGYMGYNNEWRDLAQVISRDIYSEDPNVRWDDIIGLDDAKRLVKEAVVYPIKYPQLFTGILSPWKGLLLYGPPGTGKTLLAKAVATECNTTFFNISASSIVSKWRGDSEKLVRVLFELARFHAPSTIFLDELESLMSQRGGGGGEHEGSRRMKTELLVQMDGLAKSDDLVFLLAASNLPWELDHAMLRRLEKRIIVDLPTMEARKAMFQHHLPTIVCTADSNGLELTSDLQYDLLAQKTESYSGSDIRLVCKEAAMRPLRKIFDSLEAHTEGDGFHIELEPLTTEDVLMAVERTKPSARTLKDKYEAWQHEYESV